MTQVLPATIESCRSPKPAAVEVSRLLESFANGTSWSCDVPM
jgi:hypothetical protein